MVGDKKRAIVSLSLFFLLISTFIYRSGICCMFNATRYYGWPSSFIVVSKTTEFLDEAKKVETENLVNLINNGWKVSFQANQIGQPGLSSLAILNLITNYLFYLIITTLLIRIISYLRIKNKSPTAYENHRL